MPGRLAIYDDRKFKQDCKKMILNDMIKNLNPMYNIAPTLAIPALLNNGNYLYTQFGFLPSWAKDKSSLNINARSESIFEKNTFRESFKKKRCLIPINGYYEWEKKDKEKLPYLVSSSINEYMALAGIWEEWYDINSMQNIVTVAVITCDSNEKIERIHHRMPVVLNKNDFATWLYNDDISVLNSLFKVAPSNEIQMFRVSSEVNKVSFNHHTCIKKLINLETNQLSLF